MKYTLCYPLSKGNYYNEDMWISTGSTKQELEQAQNQHLINLTCDDGMVTEIQLKQNDHLETQKETNYVDEKLIQAFGVTLINADSYDTDDIWVK